LNKIKLNKNNLFTVRGFKMIAEIRGKISHTGSNLTERLEDYLTGNGERMIL
jgi:hypothetical protein